MGSKSSRVIPKFAYIQTARLCHREIYIITLQHLFSILSVFADIHWYRSCRDKLVEASSDGTMADDLEKRELIPPWAFSENLVEAKSDTHVTADDLEKVK